MSAGRNGGSVLGPRVRGDASAGRASRGGFTLLEVMLALGIVTIMASLVYASFSPTYQAKEIVEKQAEHYHGLRLAMNRLTRDISMAFISDRFDAKRFRERPTHFVGERDSLRFTTLAHERLYEDAKEGDQAVVEYRVDRDPDNPRIDSLIRRSNPVIDDRPEDGGYETVLAADVDSIEFQYWDVKKTDWVNDWDTTDREYSTHLPERVRITITAKGDDGKPRKYTSQAMIQITRPLGSR